MQNSHACLWACYPISVGLNSSSLCLSVFLSPPSSLLLCIHLFPLDNPLVAAQALRREHQRSSLQEAKEADAKERRSPEREARRWKPEERPSRHHQVSISFCFQDYYFFWLSHLIHQLYVYSITTWQKVRKVNSINTAPIYEDMQHEQHLFRSKIK